MVEQLKQFLVGPGREVGGVQIIQNKEGRVADLFKQARIRESRIRLVGGAQMIQQVRHDDIERGQTVG